MGSLFGGGGGGTSTTVQNADPWSGQQPYLKEIFSKAQGLYGAGELAPSAPTQSYVAPLSSETEQALQMQTQRSLAGSPLVTGAQNELQNTVSGNYLSGGNPYFSQMASDISREVIPQVASQFAGSGRYGSGMANRATSDALASKIGDLAYQNYGDERTRQMQASALAPTLANQDYTDASQLAAVGTARENQAQSLLSEQQQNYLTEENKNALGLQNYYNLISGNYGGTTSTTSPQTKSNPLGSALGGAAAGAGIGNMIMPAVAGSLGMGAAGGAGLGALFGLFSDRRLKENIKSVGKLDNGLTVYSYNYIWDKIPRIGLMADEVKEKHPNAVFEVDGYDAVMYDKAVEA